MIEARIATPEWVSPYRGVTCPRCRRPLDLEQLDSGPARCPQCRRRFTAAVFHPPARGAPPAAPARDQQAACATHPRNAAEIECARCGVFICDVCRIDSDAMALCPACFERLYAGGALSSTRTTFADFGARASSAAAIGFFFCLPFGAIVGPLAMYYGIRGLRQKTETLGSRGGIYAAILLGLAETLMSGLMWIGMIVNSRTLR